MKVDLIFILLDILGLLILFKWIRNQLADYRAINNKKSFYKFSRFKYFLLSLLFIAFPLILVNYTDFEKSSFIPNNFDTRFGVDFYSIMLSFFISMMWLGYVTKLDIFNKEKKRHILLTLIISILLTLLINIPYSYIHSLGIINSKEALPGFVYTVFGIGLVEETVKLIPLLVLWLFTKAIDEPFDFILYASTAALGFAFVENAMYLHNYGIHIVNARALYATVAHMSFSSIVAYGLFLVKFKKTSYHAILVIPFFFFLAMLSHGFYDFWLINEQATKYNWLTTLFLLFSVHIWFSIKNNTINVSNFYNEKIKLNNDKLKVYLIIGLLSLFMFSYVYIAAFISSNDANMFFKRSAVMYGYIIFYIIATLTKYDLVKGVLKPFKLSFQFLFPRIRK